MPIRDLIGAGDRIVSSFLPLALIGTTLNIWKPGWFSFADSAIVLWIGILLIVPGLVGWIWSVVQIATHIPKNKLITSGPFRIVRHPLYTSIGLLVLPGSGLLLNTWIGIPLGIILYAIARICAESEEKKLETQFGEDYRSYRKSVFLPWL